MPLHQAERFVSDTYLALIDAYLTGGPLDPDVQHRIIIPVADVYHEISEGTMLELAFELQHVVFVREVNVTDRRFVVECYSDREVLSNIHRRISRDLRSAGGLQDIWRGAADEHKN